MKVKKIKRLTNEKWLNLYEAQYEHQGKLGRWVYASRKPQPVRDHRADAVVIVPILRVKGKKPRLVFLKEYRAPIDGYCYALPAGLLEKGEAIEECVRREMLEETGLEVTRFRRISPPLYSSTGLTDETAAMAYVDVRATPGSAQALDGLEDIEVLLLDHAAACRLCDNTDLPVDAKAWNTLLLYQQLGSFEHP